MDWTTPVIPFHLHPLGFIDAFTQLGARMADLLASIAVPRKALKSAQERISYQQFTDLIHAGLAACPLPALGLHVSERFRWYYHGITGMAIETASTFNQAGLAFQRYSCLAQPYYLPFHRAPDHQRRHGPRPAPFRSGVSAGPADPDAAPVAA